jgi:enoyl-CoA hydratase/carnithine racemase
MVFIRNPSVCGLLRSLFPLRTKASSSTNGHWHESSLFGYGLRSYRTTKRCAGAAVRGPASGGGFALALAADVRLAGESARFNAAFIKIGLSACDMGVSYFLPRAVGTSIASELMLTGRFINASRALATGLVSEVVADGELDAAAGRMAQEMVETSPLGLRLTKECLAASVDAGSLEQAIYMEDRNQTLCVRAGYIAEGARAFVEKRKPNFTDRA